MAHPRLHNSFSRCTRAPTRATNNRVKVSVGGSHNVVAISNCVTMKWGGEQMEAKGQSVEPALSVVVRYNESDSAGQGGESAST